MPKPGLRKVRRYSDEFTARGVQRDLALSTYPLSAMITREPTVATQSRPSLGAINGRH